VATSGDDNNPGTLAAPWRTIQHAVNAGGPNITIFVRAGVYNEAVTINVSGSASAGYLTIQNYSNEAPILDGTNLTISDATNALFAINNQSYIKISGFELRNYRTADPNLLPAGVLVQGANDHIEIRNNRIHNIETSATSGNAHGIAVYGNSAQQTTHDIIIDGNEIYNLKLGFSETLTVNGNVELFQVTNNLIHDNDNIGIDIIGAEGVSSDPTNDQARNGLVRANTVYNIDSYNNPAYAQGRGADGIYVDGGRDVVIEQNNISTSDIGLELASEHKGKTTSGVIARNNLIYHNLVIGISIGGYDSARGGTENCTIINNTLFQNDTLATGSGEFGIQYYALNNTFKNNIVYSSSQGQLVANSTNTSTSSTQPNLLKYNLYYVPSGGNSTWQWGATTYHSISSYQSSTGEDANSLVADPLFVNSTATPPDLHLNAQANPKSPAVDAGEPNSDPNVVGIYDVFGQTRIQGSSIDIGAVEMATTPTTANYTYYLPFLASNYIPAGQSFGGGFTSFVAFQNSGSSAANISIQYADQAGNNLPTNNSTASCATLAANAECIPPNPFQSGGRGTGIISSSQPLNVIVAEATPFGGSAYPVAAGAASSLIAPLALNSAFGGYITQLTTYNGGATATPVTIQFYKDDGTHVAAADQTTTIPAHSSFTLDQTASSSQLPLGFSGWAQITGAAGSSLVVQVLEQNPTSHFVAIANAQHQTSQTVYAPAIFNKAYGSFATGANIVNPNSSPLTVLITYYLTDGTAYPAAPFSLGAYAIASIYQGASSGNGLPSGGLPNGFAGSAVVTTAGGSGGVVMVVNENGGSTSTGSAMSGTYAAASSGANRIGLPVMANGGYGYTTGATILNISNQPVSGSVQYYNASGAVQGSPQTFTIGAHGSQAIFQGGSSNILPNGFYGAAIVTQTNGSSNSLIVTTNAISSTFFYTYTEPNNN
jgi:hypothetical protein